MTQYRVRADIRRCDLGGRFVGLDLATNRYFLLDGTSAEDLAAFDRGTADSASLARLIDRRLIEKGAVVARPPSSARPTSSLLDHRLPRPSPWLLLRSMAALHTAQRDLGHRSIIHLIAPTGLEPADPDQCLPVAAAFARTSRYRDATDRCFTRSLAMRAMLARRGLGVDLVIGVMLPFAAHCWLQAGTTVLSDSYDQVRNFTPLLTAR